MTFAFYLRAAFLLAVPALAIVSAQVGTTGVNEYQFGGYTFKLMNNGQMGQMLEGPKLVGTIYTVNGQQQLMPIVAEPEATKVRKAFDDWKAAGRTGSTEAPKSPVAFEPDGSAVVPMQDGTVVTFKPTYIEVSQPNALASIPGQVPITSAKFMLNEPPSERSFSEAIPEYS
jgi:hypothetical protein